jgi:sec-independent protein translocase protein TatC
MALVPFPNQSRDEEVAPYAPDPDSDDHDPEDDLGGRMSFLEHLDELRKRLTHAVVALLVGFLIAFSFVDRIWNFVMQPLTASIPGGKFVYTEPAEAFFLYMWVAAIVGLMIASPYVMYQVWLFIAPGLYSNEKKLAIPFVFFSTSLFLLGAAFSHYTVFPWAFQFFSSFSSETITFMPRIEPVFSMYTKLLLAMGLVFQMPILVLVLARFGLVTAGFLWRNIKYAVLIIFIAAAVLTPSADPVGQTLMAAPMFVLYVVSIGVAWLFGKKQEADDASS